MDRSIWIGFDPRQCSAYAVTRRSVEQHAPAGTAVHGLVLSDLQARGLYRRPLERRDAVLWDTISKAPMATEHACSRFLTPELAGNGWAMFMDGDMLVRSDLSELFDQLDPKYAVYCVKHDHDPAEGGKMVGQVQTRYPRKNWSSLMVFNCLHYANDELTVDVVNTLPGRDLHRFCWLDDCDIGALDPKWNFLVGHSDTKIDPAIVHFTEGVPDMPGYHGEPYADEWRAQRQAWAA